MRKRSKYKPFAAVTRLMERKAWEKQKAMDVADYGSLYRDLLLKNHGAMDALVKGRATADDFNLLLQVSNTVQSLLLMDIGAEYADVADEGLRAMQSVGERAESMGRFVLKASEITALNAYMELHDAQIAIITVAEMNRSIELLKQKKVEKAFHVKFQWRETHV